ncbi:Flp family type IVb pilin [Sphingomonas flavalba]|uniref:Flp family type IVb pilin n=1 Tax=Sphingomonas flavalba TaxID=2559804 RepID=UPI0039DF4117
MRGCVGRLARDLRGATAIEYGLVAALISLGILGSLTAFAGTSIDIWARVAAKFATG